MKERKASSKGNTSGTSSSKHRRKSPDASKKVQKGKPLLSPPASSQRADCTVYLTGVKYLKQKVVDGKKVQRAKVALGFSLSGVKETEKFGGFNLRFLAHETREDIPASTSQKKPAKTPPVESAPLGVPECNPAEPQTEYLDSVEYNIQKGLEIDPEIKAREVEFRGVDWSESREGKRVSGCKVEFNIENAPGTFEVVLRNHQKAAIPRLYYIMLTLTKCAVAGPTNDNSVPSSSKTSNSASTLMPGQDQASNTTLDERSFAFQISLVESRALMPPALSAPSRLMQSAIPFDKKEGQKGKRTSDSITMDYSNDRAIHQLDKAPELGLTYALEKLKPRFLRNELKRSSRREEPSDDEETSAQGSHSKKLGKRKR